MSYQLNETVFGVFLKFENQNNTKGFIRPYDWDDISIAEIKFIEMVVVEHRKIRWNYGRPDDTSNYDGYILKGKDGAVFYNQYPFATFEQIENSLNYSEGEYVSELKNSEQYSTLALVLQTIQSGICLREDQLRENDASEARTKSTIKRKIDLLQALKNRIIEEFEEKFPEYKVSLLMLPVTEGSSLLYPLVKVEKK